MCIICNIFWIFAYDNRWDYVECLQCFWYVMNNFCNAAEFRSLQHLFVYRHVFQYLFPWTSKQVKLPVKWINEKKKKIKTKITNKNYKTWKQIKTIKQKIKRKLQKIKTNEKNIYFLDLSYIRLWVKMKNYYGCRFSV